jgi:hypothetical protein
VKTHGPSPTHWNNGKEMTPRERKKRAGFLAHVKRQQEQQTGGSGKFNIAIDDGSAEIIVLLDNVTND